jgi:hypothetical protein
MMSSTPKRPRWRPRISLASLVLLFITLSALVVMILMKRDMDVLRAENARLSAELGRLYIVEKDKVHVLAPQVSMAPQWTWHWRIYVPEGRHYALHAVAKDVPAKEIPLTKLFMPVSGEFSLDARLQKDNLGNWQLAFLRDSDYGITIPFDPPGPDFLATNNVAVESVQLGADKTLIETPPNKIVLLRLREQLRTPVNGAVNVSKDPNPSAGVMLWLEELTPEKWKEAGQ